jgi:hypothetical protein
MTPAVGVAAELVLVLVDPVRQRLPVRQSLAPLVRGAVLAELAAAGHVVDDDGRARAVPDHPVDDPVLGTVYRAVCAQRPRRWTYWIRRDARSTVEAVLDQLDAADLLRVRRSRVLGIFPATRLEVPRPEAVVALRARLTSTVEGPVPVPEVPQRDALLVALCDAGGLLVRVVGGSQRRAHKDRLMAFRERAGAVVPAVRAVMAAVHSVAASVAAGGGGMGGGAAAGG